MHPNSQRQLREVVAGRTGPASRLPVTISLPGWLVVYRDSPHQHTGIVQRPCLTPFWTCSLITTYIRRLHLTRFSHVEERTHTHAKFDYFKLLCAQTVPEQHASLFTSGQMAARSVSERALCYCRQKKNAADIVFLANSGLM